MRREELPFGGTMRIIQRASANNLVTKTSQLFLRLQARAFQLTHASAVRIPLLHQFGDVGEKLIPLPPEGLQFAEGQRLLGEGQLDEWFRHGHEPRKPLLVVRPYGRGRQQRVFNLVIALGLASHLAENLGQRRESARGAMRHFATWANFSVND